MHMDFLHLFLLTFIIIIFLTPNTMDVYHGLPKPLEPWTHKLPMVKRNKYPGDLVEELDDHQLSPRSLIPPLENNFPHYIKFPN